MYGNPMETGAQGGAATGRVFGVGFLFVASCGMNIGMKMAKRGPMGGTKKVTISLRSSDLDVMTRFAERRHGGNLSGAFAELVSHATRLEAMDRVLEELPPPSPEGLARLEAELARPLERPSKGKRSKKAAA